MASGGSLISHTMYIPNKSCSHLKKRGEGLSDHVSFWRFRGRPLWRGMIEGGCDGASGDLDGSSLARCRLKSLSSQSKPSDLSKGWTLLEKDAVRRESEGWSIQPTRISPREWTDGGKGMRLADWSKISWESSPRSSIGSISTKDGLNPISFDTRISVGWGIGMGGSVADGGGSVLGGGRRDVSPHGSFSGKPFWPVSECFEATSTGFSKDDRLWRSFCSVGVLAEPSYP